MLSKNISFLLLLMLNVVFAQEKKPSYAIAIHGGAGVIPKTMPDSVKNKYIEGLEFALKEGSAMLAQGRSGLDVVEHVVRILEDNPLFNAGKGAVFAADGSHELDASIMNGKTLACGSVAGVKTIKNPISLARLVMEKTPHVFLTGSGADAFGKEMKVEIVDQKYFDDSVRYEQWKKANSKTDPNEKKGTVGCVVLDKEGNLYAATSTGGMTNKRIGRVGDTPVIGAGTYAKNATCAVSCTGTGEEFIRYAVAHSVSALMEYKNLTLEESANQIIHGTLKKGDGGLIAVDKGGNVAMIFNSPGMFRGTANSEGRFEIKIWE